MKVDLGVLASTSIKRRKPWQKIVWVGKEKESLFLLDSRRVSVLYVPSGKTKRKIPRLSQLVEDSVRVSCTKHALFVVGLLQSGNVFLWHKDQDFIKMVAGLSNIASVDNIQQGNSELCVSDDCTKILVVIDNSLLYLWQMDAQDSLGDTRVIALSGKWLQINVPDRIQIPSSDCLEATLSAMFYSSQVLGDCCQCSVVFNNRSQLCVNTLQLRFSELHQINNDSVPSVHAEWCSNQYPMQTINSGFEEINAKGSYFASYSPDGQVLAVAANQKHPMKTCMLFLSPLTETLLVSEMRGCGVSNTSKSGRQYWVSHMSWTSDNLLLACILRNGSVCLLSRLGEPLVIQTSGCNVDIGPSRFLPLHPVISIQHDGDESHHSVEDPLGQKFSVSTHPSLPIILFSDGYMVTVVQLPSDISCMTIMRDLVIESSRHLNYIQENNHLNLSLANAYNLPSDRKDPHSLARKRDATRESRHHNEYLFEEPEGGLNETQDSDVSFVLQNHTGFPQLENLSSGKIIFGEPEMELATIDASFVSMEEQEAIMKHLQVAKLSLFASWKLAVSCSEPWTENLDRMAKHTVNNMIKLFSIILDCSVVHDLVCEKQMLARVQNAGLFQVITVYKQMLELLQFDIFQQHLIPVALQLANKTACLIMESAGLDQRDPRLRTLNGCFTLLKFTERTLNQNYVWFPKSISSKVNSSQMEFYQRDQFEPGVAQTTQVDQNKSVTLLSDQLISRRLAAIWTSLYKNLILFQMSQCASEAEYRQAQDLMCGIQQTLQLSKTPIPQHVSSKVNPGDKHSVDGHHTQALHVWNEQLKVFGAKKNNPKAAKLMHSLLYTYLVRGELLTAVDFVDHLILTANIPANVDSNHLSQTASSESRPPLMTLVTDTFKTLAFDSPDMVPCIKDRSIRQVVQTMARFMAAYFTNKTVYIFPPHNPQSLPSIHWDTPIVNKRIIPKYHEDISSIIRQNNLSGIWTVERTLEYLLLSGLACEATWFADTMGDWKAAFLLSVACTHHRSIAPTVYSKPRKPLELPDWLLPNNILQRKLKLLVYQGSKDTKFDSKTLMEDTFTIDNTTNIRELTETLEDILTTAIVSRVDLMPWLITELVQSLKSVVCNFQTIVPQDFYLPAPPLYCPQPTDQNRSKSPAEEREVMLRKRASSIIQLIIIVLKASHLSLPVISWYVKALVDVQGKAGCFKANTEGPCQVLPDMLEQLQSVQTALLSHSNTTSVNIVLCGFRDFCTIMWMLHTRDRLSVNLRSREKHLEKISYQDYTKTDWELTEQEKWMKECFTNLKWAINLLAFSRFLPDEGSIYKIVMSLLMELPPLEDSADILAEYFYDMENLDAEVQEKLDKILFDWQTVIFKPEDDGKSAKDNAEDDPNDGRKSVTFFEASPRGKSLSVYFHKQCQVAAKVLKKKRKCYGSYHEFVFDPSENHSEDKLNLGSRPFETRLSYIEFLDTFASVCFGRLLEDESERTAVRKCPLLAPWVDQISSLQLSAYAEKSASNVDKKHSLIVLNSAQGSPESVKGREEISNYRKESPRNLFANHSKEELMKAKGLFRSRSVSDVTSDDSPLRKFESENSLDVLVEGAVSTHRSPHTQGSQRNLTQLASRFSHSEEALYKQPEHPDHSGWSLNVNFGRRYMPLAKLLEWLEAWSKKRHSLGMGSKEQKFNFKPQIKIHIPAQLILLSVWLLEHKYNPNKPDPELPILPICPPHTNPQHSRLQKKRVKHIDRMSYMKNTSSLYDGPGPQPSTSVSSSQQRSRSASPPQRSHSSPEANAALKGSALLEEQSVQTAYEHLLDGPDESSSLEVSSLELEDLDGDLRRTYMSVFKGTGSPNRQESASQSMLRRTIHLSVPSSKSEDLSKRFSNTTPVDMSRRSLKGGLHHDSSISLQRSQSRSPSPHTGRHFSSPKHGRARSPSRNTALKQVSATSDLAHQLQSIVRTEMRRIMEVQHKSLMVMMGAIDEPSHDVEAGSRMGIKDGDHTLHVEELHSSKSSTTGISNPVRGILKELKNLQQGVDQPQQLHSFHGLSESGRNPHNKENIHSLPLHISALRGTDRNLDVYSAAGDQRDIPLYDVERIPKFLRIPAEKDTSNLKLHLPRVPFQAWSDDRSASTDGSRIAKMPLLRLDGGYVHSNLFNNVHKTAEEHFPSFPAEQESRFAYPPSANSVPPVPMPPDSMCTGPFGIPLLNISKPDTQQFMNVNGPSFGPSFGRLVDPDVVLAHEREIHQKEMEKQRHLQEFNKRHVQEHSEVEAQRFGEQLLSVNFKTQDVKEQYVQRQSRRQSPAKRRGVSPTQPQSRHSPQTRSDYTEESGEFETGTEQEEIEDDRSNEIKEELHDGYALRPGAFDAYLELGKELGINDDTDAKFQYQLAMKLKQQQDRKKKKVDFATMTQELIDNSMSTDPAMEVIRTAEAATSITKDTGSDPIQEALIEYNRSRQGTVIPPDIFLGLKFGDQPAGQTGETQEQARGRSYLNVVDIRASAVLKDIAEKPSEQTIQADTTLKASSLSLSQIRKAREDMETFEEGLRAELEPRRHPTHDSLTVKMFETRQPGMERVSVAVMPRGGQRESKIAMVRRLHEMNHQMEAIDRMSQNIESDFHNTKLLVNTIERIGDVIDPTVDDALQAEVQTEVTDMDVPSKQPTPKMSPKLSARPASRMTRSAESVDISHMSGLSGLSDILGEIIADGGINLEEAGLSPREAEKLVKKARGKMEKGKLRMSVEKLKHIVEQTEINTEKHDPEWHEMIQGYMADKRSERHEVYRKHRAELRDHEVKPYTPSGDPSQVSLGTEALHETLKEREEVRQIHKRRNMERRIRDAELLVGSMIVEKPDLPPLTSSPIKPSSLKTSPKLIHKAMFSKMSPVLSRRSTPDAAHKIFKPTIARKGPVVSVREQRDLIDRTRILGGHTQMQIRGILKTSVSPSRDMKMKFNLDSTEVDVSMGASEELLDYARAMDEMEKEQIQHPEQRDVKAHEFKPYKEKSFKDLVRLQRPEITRNVAAPIPDHVARPGPTSIEQNISESRMTTARDSSPQEKMRLYGSKHIQSSTKVVNVSPRRVKTYAERLQEMKPCRKYSTPIIPRQHIPASARTPSVHSMSNRRPTGPMHKPQTYVQQLQKLNAGAVRKMKGGKTITIQPRTFMKTRKPHHEPRTYTEQLQALQPPKEQYRTARSNEKSLLPRGRGITRARPYAYPYRSMQEDIAEGWEVKSEVSDWTIDDDVKQLLYGDDSSRVYTVGSMDYQMSEGVSDYFDYVMGDDYTASVDIDEIANIADAASVDSGSVLSVIDWDAVEQIIAHED